MTLQYENKDILIKVTELKQDVAWLKLHFENHLKHHFWINITLLSIIGGLVVALLLK